MNKVVFPILASAFVLALPAFAEDAAGDWIDVWGHKVFLVVADALTRCGLVVLRFDKRGVGGSTGDYDAATTADFTSDADAAVTWLKTQPKIDPHHVGVLGHSEGGIIAPAVAAQDKGVAFVVMIAGPAIRGDKLFVLQSAMTAKAYGAPADYIAKRKVFDDTLFNAVISAPSDTAALASAKMLVAKAVADKIVDPAEADTLPGDVARPWERHFLAYDPAPTLTKLTVPVLALNGSLDVRLARATPYHPRRASGFRRDCASLSYASRSPG